MDVDVRKLGIWMVALGGTAMAVGIVGDAVQQADDPTLAARKGVFDLSTLPHALLFGGLCLAIIGVLAMLFGRALYTPGAHVTVGRRLLQVGAPLAAVALIAGCATVANNSRFAEPNTTAAEAEAASTDTHSDATTGTEATDGHAHTDTGATPGSGDTSASGHSHGTVIAGTATGDSPCEIASPTPASPGQVGAGQGGSAAATAEAEAVGEHGARGMVVQTMLTQDERVLLEQQMAAARTVVVKYPTVKDAEAAGYRMSTPYVPCIGAHYTNVGLVAKFDPAAPSELLYDGTTPDAKLVGLSYLVFSPQGAPEGFAGANDHWHQHNANGGLCFNKTGTVIGGEDTTKEQCAQRGGEKRELKGIWMAHAWVVPGFECSWGVFSGECPELGGRVGGTAWDSPN
jgi:hypothetical protein